MVLQLPDLPPSYSEINLGDNSIGGFSETEREQPPPQYSEVTLPLSDIFVGFPNTILLDGGGEIFPDLHIRDTNGCLLVQVSINTYDGTTRLKNTDGKNFLLVKSNPIRDSVRGRKFETFHHDVKLGFGEVLDAYTMNLSNKYENILRYSIDSAQDDGEIIVSRTVRAPPICHMNLPFDGFGSKQASGKFCLYNGRINFQSEAVTRVEECLCISLAMIFMMRQSDYTFGGAARDRDNSNDFRRSSRSSGPRPVHCQPHNSNQPLNPIQRRGSVPEGNFYAMNIVLCFFVLMFGFWVFFSLTS